MFDTGLIVALSLAVWRVCSLLYDEEGPWGIAQKLRERLGIQHDEEGNPVLYPSHLQPMECFWCLSLLVAFPFALLTCKPRRGILGSRVIVLLTISAGSIMIERWMRIGRSRK